MVGRFEFCFYLRLAVFELALPLAEVSLPLVPPPLQLPGFQRVGLELHLVGLRVVLGLRKVLLCVRVCVFVYVVVLAVGRWSNVPWM